MRALRCAQCALHIDERARTPATQYLVESIRNFPTQRRFARMIRDAGFQLVGYSNFTFGVVAMHWGTKL